MNESLIKKIYLDIVNGYSTFELDSQTFYLKHLTPKDATQIQLIYDENFEEAKSKSVMTEKEKLEDLTQNKQWTIEDENAIANLEKYIENLKVTKSNLSLPSERLSYENLIKEEEVKLNSKKNLKKNLFGLTAEHYALTKMNDAYNYLLVYDDEKFQKRSFTKEEYGDLELEFSYMLNFKTVEIFNNFSTQNIKKVSISNFFQTIFVLASDEVFNFYGKPIVDLSYNQQELFLHGKVFKNIFKEHQNIPPNIASDPDKIIDWVNGSEKLKQKLEAQNKEGGASMVFGATREDLDSMNIKTTSIKQQFKENKSKKSLGMHDLLKMHGHT